MMEKGKKLTASIKSASVLAVTACAVAITAMSVQSLSASDSASACVCSSSTSSYNSSLPLLKDAFIFSSLSGLRWSDVQKMIWSEIQHSNEMGWYIRFRQQKTKGVETLPISDQARKILGDEDEPEERVFKGLKYSSWHNVKLQQWMMRAGVSKTISFHCARHTYATLQLTLGTDIYTVSKLLGHKELKTTQIYAKVIDEKKREAANKIHLDL